MNKDRFIKEVESLGIEITDKLQEFFKDIINVKYTKEMEDDLDKIADGNLLWTNLLDRFYNEFEPKVTPELLELDNVVLSPHIGTGTIDGRIEMCHCCCDNINWFLNGEFDKMNRVN